MQKFINLSELDGNNGFSVYGANADDCLRYSVTPAGDVNRDGYADIFVEALDAASGAVYVIFGKSSGFPASFDLSTLDAGIIIDDPYTDLGNKGRVGAVYVIFGKPTGFPASFDLTPFDGANGFSIYGTNVGDLLGVSVGTAGDVNNDGYADIIMGAPYTVAAGAAYILFGTSSTSTPTATSSPSTTSTPTASSASSISAGSSYLLMAGALTYLAGEVVHDWMKSDTKAKPIEPIAEKATRQGSSFMSSRSKTLAALASSKTDYPSFSKAAQPEVANGSQESSMRIGISI